MRPLRILKKCAAARFAVGWFFMLYVVRACLSPGISCISCDVCCNGYAEMAVTRFPLAAFIVCLFGTCLSLGISCIFYALFMQKRFKPKPWITTPWANFMG
jgi:hypothetical protein